MTDVQHTIKLNGSYKETVALELLEDGSIRWKTLQKLFSNVVSTPYLDENWTFSDENEPIPFELTEKTAESNEK